MTAARPYPYNKNMKRKRRSNYQRVAEKLDAVLDMIDALWDHIDAKIQEIRDDLVMIYNELPEPEEREES